jgi:hypothetical protein
MRNIIIQTALIVGTLATPMIAMADAPKKDAPAAKDTKDTKDASAKKEARFDESNASMKKDAKAPAKKARFDENNASMKKDAKAPAAR